MLRPEFAFARVHRSAISGTLLFSINNFNSCMKSAAQSAEKFVRNAGNATQDYSDGAQQTTKDQSAAAIAAKGSYASGVQKAISRGAYEKGLQRSGKQGWLKGVTEKGANRFAEGVASSRDKYATESGKYDGARGAAASLPRGSRGSAENYNRSAAVGKALNAQRVGTSA